MNTKILLVDDEPITRLDLKMMLESYGFEVAGQAADGLDAIELCKKVKPDIVLMDIKMPGVDGLKATKIIKQENYAKEIILITAFSDQQYIEKAMEHGVYSYVVKPITETNLMPMLQVASKRCNEVKTLQKRIVSLKDDLAARKLIEKAKGHIIVEKKINEQEAYGYLRRMAMNKRCPIKDIAEAIIKIYE